MFNAYILLYEQFNIIPEPASEKNENLENVEDQQHIKNVILGLENDNEMHGVGEDDPLSDHDKEASSGQTSESNKNPENPE